MVDGVQMGSEEDVCPCGQAPAGDRAGEVSEVHTGVVAAQDRADAVVIRALPIMAVISADSPRGCSGQGPLELLRALPVEVAGVDRCNAQVLVSMPSQRGSTHRSLREMSPYLAETMKF